MEHEPLHPIIVKESSIESFDSYLSRPYIGEILRKRLSEANALIIPNEGYDNRSDLVYFPSGTEDLYQFLKDKNVGGLNLDACIEDKDYKEVALHADWLILAGFLVTELVAPLIVALLAEYIKKRLGKRESETIVKARLIIRENKDGHYAEYKYEGPASEYREAMTNAISKVGNPKSPAAVDRHELKQHHHRNKH